MIFTTSKPRNVISILAVLLTLLSTTLSHAALIDIQDAQTLSASAKQEEAAIEIGAERFGLPLANDEFTHLYQKPSVLLQQDEEITFKVNIDEDNFYTVSFDMLAAGSPLVKPEGQLQVDGDFPVSDARRIVFPIFYQNQSNEFPLDRYGNQALIPQVQMMRWAKVPMRDANFSLEYPVQIYLTKGEHRFNFQVTQEAMYLGSVYIQPFTEYKDYQQYLADNPALDSNGFLIEMEAEFPAFKNDTSIRPVHTRSLEVTPYDTYKLMLNTLGGESWQDSGTTVYYEFEVPEDGYYYITLRAIQNTKNNFTVYRKIAINDEVPFKQVNQVPFRYSTDWSNQIIGGETPFKIYLSKGSNILGIEATDSPYRIAIERIQQALIDINNLSLEIKKLTGNQPNRYKEWEITEYIPDLKQRLVKMADELQADKDTLFAINGNLSSQEILAYQIAIDNIRFLAADPNKVPIYLNRLSEGSGSAAQLLGTVLPSLQSQPLAIDKIYIHSADRLPEEVHIPFSTSFTDGLKRFVYSFQPDPYYSIEAGEDELNVWVNRPRQYVDLLQSLSDETFTPETGIRVKFSIMPDESKLVLANAAGIQPDVALGVSTNIPFELAIRNALKDLRSYDDFDAYIHVFSPGAFLSYIINESVYALPETQDFWVTFYRKDILNSLGIPVPKTWDEVIEILPELQRYGMNYNTPLSSGSGFKPYLMTAPYIFNFGGQLYSPDGFSTGLDSEEAIRAMKFMAESFTIYGMPIQTANFYDSFRYGNLPIGVSNFETYIKLMTAAPELVGLWDIDLYPATVLEDGTQNRYATGSAQASIIFGETTKPEESWEFMKWWMSTDTQVSFQERLIVNYGQTYLWNSANLEAFKLAPIPREHKEVILEQWQWLQEPAKIPGSYMQEREISNAWNRIVFNGVNPRIAIDDSIVIINREITRKMEEFGYIQNGVKVKEFNVPTIDMVRRWMENAK